MRVAQDVPLAHCTAAAARPVGCVRVLCAYCARRVYALCAGPDRISLMDDEICTTDISCHPSSARLQCARLEYDYVSYKGVQVPRHV